MSEELHASVLAQWLTAAPGTEPPEDLDEEVLGAIYALRPDLAPPHRVQIEQVLGSLVAGPVADPEVAAAAISLNPDLAPDHRVGIDEILDSVTEGPFAQEAEVVDLAAARRRRLWVGAGAFAAAAMALFIVVPISDKAGQEPTQVMEKKSRKAAKKAKKARKAAKRTASAQHNELPEAPMKDVKRDERGAKTGDLRQAKGESARREKSVSSKAKENAVPPLAILLGTTGETSSAAGTSDAFAQDEADDAIEGAAENRVAEEEAPARPAKKRRSRSTYGRVTAQGSPGAADAASGGASTIDLAAAPSPPTSLDSDADEAAWPGYPDTQAFRRKVDAARALTLKNPEEALRIIRRAQKRYKRVHPRQLRLGYLQEARILDGLGRPDEAATARKNARQAGQPD